MPLIMILGKSQKQCWLTDEVHKGVFSLLVEIDECFLCVTGPVAFFHERFLRHLGNTWLGSGQESGNF